MPIKTPLADQHEQLGAQMVEFAAHWMPIQYTSILSEAKHVRQEAGLFDLCHMGRVRIEGPRHLEFVDGLVTCDATKIPVGTARYALLTREDGTIIDDLLVYRGEEAVYLCINASNRERDLAWIRAHAAGTEVQVHDLTRDLAMLALQGPKSIDVARAVCAIDPNEIGYYRFTFGDMCCIPNTLISRTGYTGEDGFEFWFPSAEAPRVWGELLAAAPEAHLKPIGLGARDTLRLEAGMPLYGHEIDDTTTPIEAGLAWAVAPTSEFVGSEAIRELGESGVSRKLIGFVSDGKRVPRFGYGLFHNDAPIGQVCSGSWSPTLDRPIGTAYVPVELASPGTALSVDFRGKKSPIEIIKLPFYKRARGS